MSMERRSFLKSLGALVGAAVLSKPAVAGASSEGIVSAISTAGAPLQSADLDWVHAGQMFLDEVFDNMKMYGEHHSVAYCGESAARALCELTGREYLPHRPLELPEYGHLVQDHSADCFLLTHCDRRAQIWTQDDHIPQSLKNPLQFNRYGMTIQFVQHPYMSGTLRVNELHGIPAEMFDESPEAITGLKCGDDWLLGWRFQMQREEAWRAHLINMENTVLFGAFE